MIGDASVIIYGRMKTNYLGLAMCVYMILHYFMSFVLLIEASRNNYTGHAIVKIHQQKLHLLGTHSNGTVLQTPGDDYDILWYETSNNDNDTYAFVRLEHTHLRRIRSVMPLNEYHIMTDNLQSWIDRDKYATEETAQNGGVQSILVSTFRMDIYQSLSQVYHFITEIGKLERIKVYDIGVSHENRPIKAVEIKNSNDDPYFTWIDAGTHAREWITVATALYLIEQIIVSGVKRNFVIVPVINVDGYEYTWTHDRMWRKNRRPYGSSSMMQYQMPDRCNGVDLNRNWDINFGGQGSSSNPCSFLYSGPGPFSEPEIRAVGDSLWILRNRIKLFISLHSFNQLWACPYAFTKNPSPDLPHHLDILRDIENVVYNTNGVKYKFGPLSTSLYVGSGFAMDWVYAKLGIVDSYLAELRDKGKFGFLLPSDQIIPTAMETWQGIVVAVERIFGSIR